MPQLSQFLASAAPRAIRRPLAPVPSLNLLPVLAVVVVVVDIPLGREFGLDRVIRGDLRHELPSWSRPTLCGP